MEKVGFSRGIEPQVPFYQAAHRPGELDFGGEHSISLVPPCLRPRLTPKQFEKVFVVNLPERPDKLDAMRLTTYLTGFDFDVIDGVKGADLSPKALPGVG